MGNGCSPSRLAALDHDLPFLVVGKGGHGIRLLPRRGEGVERMIAADANLVLGLLVEGLEVVVADGPVVEGRAFDLAIGEFEAEILRHESPRHGAVAGGPAADAAGVVVVGAFAGQDDAGRAVRIGDDAAVAGVVRAEGIAQGRRALRDQLIVVVLVVARPLAPLQEDDAQAGSASSLATMPPPAPAPTMTALTWGSAMGAPG